MINAEIWKQAQIDVRNTLRSMKIALNVDDIIDATYEELAEEVILSKPDQYLNTYPLDKVEVHNGWYVFHRDPTPEKSKGGLHLTETSQRKATWGRIIKLPEEYSGWFKLYDKILVSGAGTGYPLNPGKMDVILKLSDIRCRINDVKQFSDIEVFRDDILVDMEPDITHVKGFELPYKEQRISTIGTVVSKSEKSQFDIGTKVLLAGGASLHIYDDIEGISITTRLSLVSSEAVLAVLND